MNLPDYGPNPLSVELFDTCHCREFSEQLNTFENTIFGPDFSCDYECFRPWVESGSFFYAAVCGEAVEGRSAILSVASVLITDSESRDRLMRGEIHDMQLAPWERSRGGEPVAYLSSIVSAYAAHLRAVYDCLGTDVEAFLGSHQVQLRSGFCVATGPAGFRHLAKSGFVPVAGPLYLGKYDVMTIEPASARTAFWQRVFHLPSAVRESDTVLLLRDPAVALSETAKRDDAKEIERRLNESKAVRYRKLIDY